MSIPDFFLNIHFLGYPFSWIIHLFGLFTFLDPSFWIHFLGFRSIFLDQDPRKWIRAENRLFASYRF